MGGVFNVRQKVEYPPWRPKNKLWFALAVGVLMIGVLLIAHVVKSKVNAPMELGLSNGTWLFIGLVMAAVGLFVAYWNRHS